MSYLLIFRKISVTKVVGYQVEDRGSFIDRIKDFSLNTIFRPTFGPLNSSWIGTEDLFPLGEGKQSKQ
jgi:hypothetical protein